MVFCAWGGKRLSFVCLFFVFFELFEKCLLYFYQEKYIGCVFKILIVRKNDTIDQIGNVLKIKSCRASKNKTRKKIYRLGEENAANSLSVPPVS